MGHDFLGRSTAHDSFSIRTHRMKDLQSFVPEGASVTNENTFNGDDALSFPSFFVFSPTFP